MAIEYSVLIGNGTLSEELLIKRFSLLGHDCNSIENVGNGISIDLSDELGFFVHFIKSRNYPFNSCETIFLDRDFVFKQVLGFRFAKEYENFENRYQIMLSVIFGLMQELEERAIFLNNDSGELCFFNNGKIYLNNQSGIWTQNPFQEIVLSQNAKSVIYI